MLKCSKSVFWRAISLAKWSIPSFFIIDSDVVFDEKSKNGIKISKIRVLGGLGPKKGQKSLKWSKISIFDEQFHSLDGLYPFFLLLIQM